MHPGNDYNFPFFITVLYKHLLMKKRIVIAALCLTVLFGNAQQSYTPQQLDDMISFAAVDPLQKIFKETAFLKI